MTASSREEALKQIVSLAHEHRLASREIAAALAEPSSFSKNRTALFFASIGGVFIFSGIAAFINMFWQDMNSPSRVIITLGSGLALFVTGLLAANDVRYRKISAPILLVAAILQPTGLFVLLHEYFPPSNDLRYAGLFVFGVMLIQQFFCWCATKRPVLLFFALMFGSATISIIFDLLGISNKWNAVIVGISLLNLAYGLAKTNYRPMAGFWFFQGSILLLGGLFAVLQKSTLEPVYLGVTCFTIYISTVMRSTTLMVVSVIAMLFYIAYYTEEHFVHSIGWPAALILLGFVFIGTGVVAVRLKKKYITHNPSLNGLKADVISRYRED